MSSGRGEFLACGEVVEGGMAGPVIESMMGVCACSVLCGTFVLMSGWLEVEIFCIWGSVVSEGKLCRKELIKGEGQIGEVRGTEMEDAVEGLGDIVDGVQMSGDSVIEAEAKLGEFWVGVVVMEMKCGTRWGVLWDRGRSVDAEGA